MQRVGDAEGRVSVGGQRVWCLGFVSGLAWLCAGAELVSVPPLEVRQDCEALSQSGGPSPVARRIPHASPAARPPTAAETERQRAASPVAPRLKGGRFATWGPL